MTVREEGYLERRALEALQLARLRQLLAEILPRNRFYAAKLSAHGVRAESLHSLADLAQLPFTTKEELVRDQERHPPYGTVLTYPREHYCRLSQTSGTSGQPLRWLDTSASWQWMLDCWEKIYQIIGITSADRLCFAFSFGPFLGFWTAFEAAARRGCLCLPAGGMSSAARLRFLLENEATVLLCTPTYALRLAEVARQQGLSLAGSSVQRVVVAGEAGGSIPATRARIEEAWGARVFDHSGMTEVGPMTIECPEAPGGVHVLEGDYLVELLEPGGTRPVSPGEVGEIVVTNLGRWGSPLLRYRSGDLARQEPRPCLCGRTFLRLAGGLLGRTDALIHVRGHNVYPSAVEAVLHAFPEVAEYQLHVERRPEGSELHIRVEPRSEAEGRGLAERLTEAVRERLLFRPQVTVVAPGSLPRFEMKAQRLQVTS